MKYSLFALMLLVTDAACAQSGPLTETAPLQQISQPAMARHEMVATANAYASQAGLDILHKGGSAVDATIAAQLVLGLVEPQSSGIGGGAFLLLRNDKAGVTTSYDGRETAPASATPTLFQDAKGKPLPFPDAYVGGRAVGVPAMVRMMALAHKAHGKLAWRELFAPAITLADKGFIVGPRLHMMLSNAKGIASRFPAMHHQYYDAKGEALPVGALLKDPDYARLLREIAIGGAEVFYKGRFMSDARAAIAASPVSPAIMTEDDVAAYQPIERPPLCADYRGYHICSMGPPSSGASTMLASLKMLAGYDLKALGPKSAQAIHLITEALAVAFADRDTYLADPAFVDVPANGLLDNDYLKARAKLINPDHITCPLSAGSPPGLKTAYAAETGPVIPSTSHISVIDRNGTIAEWTGTVQAPFGSFLRVDGVLLNNELTDFAFVPARDGKPVANRVEPGKRPRSSMSPTIISDAQGRLVLGVGSAGGSRIISHVLKTVIGVLDWGLDPQAAIAIPNFARRGCTLDIEPGPLLDAIRPELEARGHMINAEPNASGLTAIRAVYDAKGHVTYQGGVDPRREGKALGD